MYLLTASVLSLYFTVVIAAPVRLNGAAQKPLGGLADRVLVDIPLENVEICGGQISARATSIIFPNFSDVKIEETNVIRIEVDPESLRATKTDEACADAFKRRGPHAEEDDIEISEDADQITALFRKEETGLWSVRCIPPIIETDSEKLPEVPYESEGKEDELSGVPYGPEGVYEVTTEEPVERKEITEETTEVTTEVTTRVTTKVTTEVTRKKTTEGATEETTEEATEETSEETSEASSEEMTVSEETSSDHLNPVKKRSIDLKADDEDDKKSRRNVAVSEFEIEII